ncbi:MAG: class I SAM-dependent methyltransferase [Leptolyngbya sp. RL_3_1]|nr:class I SAM-dependent methyltransferase [Leptolyngbya sp. RL_3_1]
MSNVRGDLRQLAIRDQSVDAIICISTIEHVGLDNQQVYGAGAAFQEGTPRAYREVMREFARVLAPGGRVFVTVPFGEYRNHGWLQVFDQAMVDDLAQSSGWEIRGEAYFRYWAEGWQVSTAAECATCQYYDIHAQPDHDPDFAAAAAQLGVSEAALKTALGVPETPPELDENGRPVGDHPPRPDFAAAAAQLGVSEDALLDALHPEGRPQRGEG